MVKLKKHERIASQRLKQEINSMKGPNEIEEHWELRKEFLMKHRGSYDRDRLASLSHTYCSIEILECRYRPETMSLIATLSINVGPRLIEWRKWKAEKKRMEEVAREARRAAAAARKSKRGHYTDVREEDLYNPEGTFLDQGEEAGFFEIYPAEPECPEQKSLIADLKNCDLDGEKVPDVKPQQESADIIPEEEDFKLEINNEIEDYLDEVQWGEVLNYVDNSDFPLSDDDEHSAIIDEVQPVAVQAQVSFVYKPCVVSDPGVTCDPSVSVVELE